MEKIVKEYRSKNKNKLLSFFTKISTGQIILIGFIFFLLIAYTSRDNVDPRYTYLIYFVLIAIIVALYVRPEKEKSLIPDYIAKEIAREALAKKVRQGVEFAYDSKVKVTPACHLKYENDLITGTSGPVAWEIGFIEYVHGSQYKKEGVIRIHPFEGIVTGISFYPMGYTGKESRDRDIVPVGVVEGKVKTTEYGDKVNK